ncbi:hypothetical protein D3C81_2159620 [compost metagenome]
MRGRFQKLGINAGWLQHLSDDNLMARAVAGQRLHELLLMFTDQAVALFEAFEQVLNI